MLRAYAVRASFPSYTYRPAALVFPRRLFPLLVRPTSRTLWTLPTVHRRRDAAPAPFRVVPFHTTPARQGVPLLLAAFKASTIIQVARTAGRVALTLVPVIIFKTCWAKKLIKHQDHLHHHGIHITEEKKAAILKRLRSQTMLLQFLLFIPAALLWLGVVASLERTPLTGRWRMIVLSPEEEDEIAAQLAGPKWHQAVSEILSAEGPLKLVPVHDWRYQWVQDTLHRLENVIPLLLREQELDTRWLDVGQDEPPLPPPAQYPLQPRRRATECMRRFSDKLCGHTSPAPPNAISGLPYSLLIADRPDAANAFSYGFGPDGASGIVVYSGFLDDILSKAPSTRAHRDPRIRPNSWLSYLFGSFRGGAPSPSSPAATATTAAAAPSHPVPTEEQTTELAILLAHEVAHLMLSHHLETLTSATIILPAIISMVSDMARTLVFPFTMLFGPFINDAIAQAGKVGSGHLTEVGEYCTSVKQEIEADVVSARLLAHAGFDARKAVAFWERREDVPALAQCASSSSSSAAAAARWSDGAGIPEGWNPARRIMGTASHPVHEVRIGKLKGELVRWELEKRVAARRRAEGRSAAERIPDLTWALF